MQDGRLPQFWVMKSSIKSAVVLGSVVAGFSVGAGGCGTEAHLSTMVCAPAAPIGSRPAMQ